MAQIDGKPPASTSKAAEDSAAFVSSELRGLSPREPSSLHPRHPQQVCATLGPKPHERIVIMLLHVTQAEGSHEVFVLVVT